MLLETWQKNRHDLLAGLTGGLPGFLFSPRPREVRGVVVFGFHQVQPQQLETNLRFLADNGYRTLNADELLDHSTGRRLVKGRAVVLSFDDGARNLWEVVYPLLRRYQMKGVAFIAPAFHEDREEPGVVAGMGGEMGVAGAESAKPRLQGTHCRGVEDSATATLETSNHHPPVTWEQLAEMDASGIIDCQSHTYAHRYLPRWPKPLPLEGIDDHYARQQQQATGGMTIRDDLAAAKNALEHHLQKKVRHLAFPEYRGTSHAIDVAKSLGYQAFWWGPLPYRPCNRAGDNPEKIVRLKGEFLRRLPGRNRTSLRDVVRQMFAHSPRHPPVGPGLPGHVGRSTIQGCPGTPRPTSDAVKTAPHGGAP